MAEQNVLDGIRIVDFTWGLSGPSSTQILGDLGADVIKIERFDGDDQRADKGSSKIGETPAGFIAYNRNKRSIVLDLKTDAGLNAALRLVGTADIVAQNFRTGVMAKFGLDYESLAPTHERLIYCSISGYGSTGPYAHKAANDVAIQARSGLMSMMGYPGLPPVRAMGTPADLTTGIFGALGVLAALHYRTLTGKGQHVEVSMIGTVMSLLGRTFGEYLVDGFVPRQLGNGTDMGTPNGAFPTKDGWITMSAVPDGRFARACNALGVPELIEDPRFVTRNDRHRNREELIQALGEGSSKMTKAEAEEALERHGVSAGAIYTIPEAANDPALSERFIDVPVSGERDSRNVKLPVDLSLTPAKVTRGVPKLGEHGPEILREIGYSEDEISEILTTARK